jgi:hypothetical protein
MASQKITAEYAIDNGKTAVEEAYPDATGADLEVSDAALAKITRTSNVLTVLVAGLALFSDGYNAQIIG